MVNHSEQKEEILNMIPELVILDDDDDAEEDIQIVYKAEPISEIRLEKDPTGTTDTGSIAKKIIKKFMEDFCPVLDDPDIPVRKINDLNIRDRLASEELVLEHFRKKVENLEFPSDIVKKLTDKRLESLDENAKDSEEESTEQEKKLFEGRLLCPIDDCTFTTDREGLLGKKAAQHLKEHGLNSKIIRKEPFRFKFKKIKKEY